MKIQKIVVLVTSWNICFLKELQIGQLQNKLQRRLIQLEVFKMQEQPRNIQNTT